MTAEDTSYMRLALEEAGLAFQKGEVPVGAVLVRDGAIMSKAHNLREILNDPTAHAEILALRGATAVSGSWRLAGSTLYVTKEPCIMCAGALVNARVSRLVYGCRDTKAGAAGSLYQIPMDNRLNHRVSVVAGVLEDECSAILKRFFRKRR